MTTTEQARNQSAPQNQDHSPEGANEKLPQPDPVSGFAEITWEELLREFITPEKKNAADSQSLMERWLKKFAPFRAQTEVLLPASTTKIGRPTVLTAAVKNQLYILLSLGMTRKQTAWYLGFDPSTVRIRQFDALDEGARNGVGERVPYRLAGFGEKLTTLRSRSLLELSVQHSVL